jgi:hypothetical protein
LGCETRGVRASFEAVVRDPDGRTFGMPTVDVDELQPFHLVARVNEEAERRCGAPVTTLRCLSSVSVDDESRHRRYELEAHGPVRGLPEIDVELPPPGNPWESPGWFGEAGEWVRERVDVPVEQRSTRSISALLRAGNTYFKAVPQMFAGEPAITAFLSDHHPGCVPEVLDVDLERGWLLMRDFGDELLSAAHPPHAWVRALESYADLQLAWVDRADDLLGVGAPDRTLPALERDLDVVLADVDAMLPGNPGGVSEAEVEALPALRARLGAAAERVAAFGIPPTLDHGDLHAGNIALSAAGPLVFDWSDACLAMPLVSVTPILAWDDQPEADGTTFRDAYLDRIGAPLEAYDDSVLLGFAHQAVSYHGITAALAPHSRWEWENVLPWLVKQLLAR